MTKEEYERIWMEEYLSQRNGCASPMLAVIAFALVLLLSSCATKTRIEYRDRDVNHYITKYVHDTLRVENSDSIHHEIKIVNDTVYDTKYVEKTRWRDRVVVKSDTCWKDSIVTEYKETVQEVVKYPKTYWYAVGISILFFIFAFVKLIRWLQII